MVSFSREEFASQSVFNWGFISWAYIICNKLSWIMLSGNVNSGEALVKICNLETMRIRFEYRFLWKEKVEVVKLSTPHGTSHVCRSDNIVNTLLLEWKLTLLNSLWNNVNFCRNTNSYFKIQFDKVVSWVMYSTVQCSSILLLHVDRLWLEGARSFVGLFSGHFPRRGDVIKKRIASFHKYLFEIDGLYFLLTYIGTIEKRSFLSQRDSPYKSLSKDNTGSAESCLRRKEILLFYCTILLFVFFSALFIRESAVSS